MTEFSTRDPVEAALEDLRVSGSLVLCETYNAPWAIEIPSETELRGLLNLGPNVRVFPFHLVREGGFSLDVEGHGKFEVACSEAALCMSGSRHKMSAGPDRRAVHLRELIKPDGPSPFAGSGEATSLICGVFMLTEQPFNPLLADLPPVMTAATSGEAADPVLEHAVGMLASVLTADPRSRRFVASRMLEIFCAELIRHHARHADGDRPGWFTGLSDPKIGAALRLIHSAPGRPWSMAELAQTAALSPSRFAARFREKVGQNVQSYLISQRIAEACKLLRDPSMTIADVADAIGYASVPAFSRSFADQIGLSPGQWRKDGGDVAETSPPPVSQHGKDS